MILITPYLFGKGFRGMAIFPFIFLKDKTLKYNKTVINHEKIHLRQQIELLWIFFFLIYFIEFFIGYIKFKNLKKAYFNISFEKEAYFNEDDLEYLKNKKLWTFAKYYKLNH